MCGEERSRWRRPFIPDGALAVEARRAEAPTSLGQPDALLLGGHAGSFRTVLDRLWHPPRGQCMGGTTQRQRCKLKAKPSAVSHTPLRRLAHLPECAQLDGSDGLPSVVVARANTRRAAHRG